VALEDHGSIRQAFSASADSYIVKPIEKVKFLKTLEDLGLAVPQDS
jgi:AmiR/NasT family two-component response regulator